MELKQMIKNTLRGAVLIEKDGSVVIKESYGFADLANEILNQCNTRFATASAGKAFVAVGILQLIEKGLLQFESKLADIIPIDWKQIDGDITVEELLTHTSGIPDYFDESVMDEYEELWIDFPNYRVRTNKDLLPLFIDKPMMYPRNEKFQYNNTGYVVLAMMIEQITGIAFDAYLQNNVFNQCYMKSTGYFELDRLPARCANNYIYDDQTVSYRTNIFSVDAKGTGAGGAFTTIEDIKLFWDGLLTHKLLSPTMTAAMMDNQSGPDGCYGYGMWLKKAEAGYIPYFQGSDPGVSFLSSYDTSKKLLLVLVSNYGDSVWKLSREINAFFQHE